MATVTISRARLSASSRASCSISRIITEVSWRISRSTLAKSKWRASSLDKAATFSNSACCLSTNCSARSFNFCASASFRVRPSSLRSSCSIFLSRVSSFCTRRRSVRCTSALRSLISRSNSWRNLYTSSLASSTDSRFFASACFLASSSLCVATISASPMTFSLTLFRYR